MHAEKILVLENGRVIGMGTHDELMASCPLYREIGESQIGARSMALDDADGKEAVRA